MLVITAIIAGIASLLGAVFTWRQAERVKRIETATQEHLAQVNAQTQVAIEAFRAEQERSKTAFEVGMAESKPIEDVLSQLWGMIQTVKEQLTLLADGVTPTNSDGQREVIGLVNSVREEFLKMYERHGASLPRTAVEAAHSAKNIMHEVVRSLEGLDGKGGFSHRQSASWMKLRLELTFCQAAVARDRSELRIRQFQKYLDILVPTGGRNFFLPSGTEQTLAPGLVQPED